MEQSRAMKRGRWRDTCPGALGAAGTIPPWKRGSTFSGHSPPWKFQRISIPAWITGSTTSRTGRVSLGKRWDPEPRQSPSWPSLHSWRSWLGHPELAWGYRRSRWSFLLSWLPGRQPTPSRRDPGDLPFLEVLPYSLRQTSRMAPGVIRINFSSNTLPFPNGGEDRSCSGRVSSNLSFRGLR